MDQVMCGMGGWDGWKGCVSARSPERPSVHDLVALGPFALSAVWDTLPVMSRRCDAMTASGNRLASAAARSTCICDARSGGQATVRTTKI